MLDRGFSFLLFLLLRRAPVSVSVRRVLALRLSVKSKQRVLALHFVPLTERNLLVNKYLMQLLLLVDRLRRLLPFEAGLDRVELTETIVDAVKRDRLLVLTRAPRNPADFLPIVLSL